MMAEKPTHSTLFTQPRIFEAQGAWLGLATCLTCGAAIVLDLEDPENPFELHAGWHDGQASS